jgi:AraC-like DNA-binding protein
MGAFYTTEAVPDHRRTAYWHDAVSGTFPAAEVSVPRGECAGTLRTSRLGRVRAATVQGGRMRLRWPARPDAFHRDQHLVVVTPVEGLLVVDQGEGSAHLSPGVTGFCDLARPTRIDFMRGYHVKCLVVPRRLLGLAEGDLRRLAATPVQPDTPSGALLWPLLTQLVDTAPTLAQGTGETLVRHVVDLISVLAQERLHGEAADVPDTARHLLARIQEHIDRHLGDPDLSLESIARAHRISVRYLHRLFEHEDTTVSRWVQRRRLQECRRELARRQAAGRTISAVARQWGFTSPAHFSRAFRAMYDMSPAEWRRFALDGPGAARPADGQEPAAGPPSDVQVVRSRLAPPSGVRRRLGGPLGTFA